MMRTRKTEAAALYLVLWSYPSVPWTPGRKNELGHTPAPGASDGSWQPAPPAADRCLQTGLERRLQGYSGGG